MLTLIIVFLIILLLFICINLCLNDNIEKYGIYCGRYNINTTTAQTNCMNDSECMWNIYTPVTGSASGWCGQNPNSISS